MCMGMLPCPCCCAKLHASICACGAAQHHQTERLTGLASGQALYLVFFNLAWCWCIIASGLMQGSSCVHAGSGAATKQLSFITPTTGSGAHAWMHPSACKADAPTPPCKGALHSLACPANQLFQLY